MTLILAILGAIGLGWLFEVLKIPAGAMIGPMIVVAAVKLSGVALPDVPRVGRFAIFVVVGWLLGQEVEPGLASVLQRVWGPVLATMGVLLLAAVLLAWLFHTVADVDMATAFLATAPGGVTQMAVVAADSGANVGFVVGLHLVRIMTVVLLTPLIVKFWAS